METFSQSQILMFLVSCPIVFRMVCFDFQSAQEAQWLETSHGRFFVPFYLHHIIEIVLSSLALRNRNLQCNIVWDLSLIH